MRCLSEFTFQVAMRTRPEYVGLRRRPRGGEARGVEVLADAVERLPRIARREALQLAVDAVARPKLHLAGADARVEAIQRPGRGPTDADAPEVVDASVTGADERARRLLVGDVAPDVRAARRDRHDLVEAVGGVGVDGGVATADE